ncbi:sirohydrochlorin chelatase [Robertmurraya andreesenii]|uniref:Sirohydrochlorin ferrochelatase/sirohydrochlorin cobaltochelatase n=1 Tax=Anoxybacillus andreesenii TaxID=1325932 RepID=A0ABT9V6J5_9BACL|nr:sirohydrochlorin chelatase [Robertmurraya andreesenii]MDQ0156542.1 sirohydrochlorin ferrochelatase/sirohydrochlorin cobaltochelatase [Robertmurraya andreesenii]
MDAVIYLAHGSQRSAANEKFVDFIKRIMQHSPLSIQAYGFLENAQPSIAQTIESCIEQGARRITVVPVFLLPGIHTNVDIPIELGQYPDVIFHYGKPLGVDDIMVDILADKLADAGFGARDNEAVLLVGHGSRLPEAGAEFERLAISLAEKARCSVHPAYVTTPVYYQEIAAKLVEKKIFILPHFLFSGGFTDKMKRELEWVEESIIFCEPVGFNERLIPLIEKRVAEVHDEFNLSDYVTP